jgi:hypothetical protein
MDTTGMTHAMGQADTLEDAIAQTLAFLQKFPKETFFAVAMDAECCKAVAQHLRKSEASAMMMKFATASELPFVMCLGALLDPDENLMCRSFGDKYEDFVSVVDEARALMDQLNTTSYKFLTLTNSPVLFEHNRRYMGLPDMAPPSPPVLH